MTLAQAQARLAYWIAAEPQAGSRVQFPDGSLMQYPPLDQVQASIAYWERIVNNLSAGRDTSVKVATWK